MVLQTPGVASRRLRSPGVPRQKPAPDEAMIEIPSKQYGFIASGRSGGHARLLKVTPGGKAGTVVPLHGELKASTIIPHPYLSLPTASSSGFCS